MSKTLEIKTNTAKTVSILDISNPQTLIFNGENTYIECENGKQVVPSCIDCQIPYCMYISSDNLHCSSFPHMSYDVNNKVCPSDAIVFDDQKITINTEECFGCGLCAASCPLGAIYIKNGKAVIRKDQQNIKKLTQVNTEGFEIQKNFLEGIKKISSKGVIIKETNTILLNLYKKIDKLPHLSQNRLVRNLLNLLSIHATLSRDGDIYSRMDGFYATQERKGVFEVEVGMDMLEVSRAILDDVAVLNSRYDILKSGNNPLAIVLMLPNKRVDYWQVIKDIEAITQLRINTITIGALLMLVWNCKNINNFDEFYLNVDNYSLRETLERLLGRTINITYGFLGILENRK